jgi:hypothetical protein
MSSLDSVAVFAKRVEELKLGPYLNEFTTLGWDSMGSFAFSCAFSPGQADDSSFLSEVVVPLLKDPAHVLKPQLRRLFFEAYTLAALDVQRRASPTDDMEKPKKLPAPERLSRLRVLKARLKGLVIAEELEPSDALIDKFNAQKEDGNLRFVPWSELTRRDDEIKYVKKNKAFETDSSGRLKVGEEHIEEPADTATDLKLKSALQRRGIAMEVAQLLSFEVHDKYVSWLFRQLARKPFTGFHQVSIQQIHELDAEVFLKLAEQTREGLDLNIDGTYRLDALLLNAMADPQVTMLAMPRQRPMGQASSDLKRSFSEVQGGDSGPNFPSAKGQGKTAKGQGSGKGQGKSQGKTHRGKRSKDTPMVPLAFKDAKGTMCTAYKGKRVCFAYNLQGCNLPVGPTGECIKGLHVCAREGCGGNHPQSYTGCPMLK